MHFFLQLLVEKSLSNSHDRKVSGSMSVMSATKRGSVMETITAIQ